jgi:putative hemolysin
MCKRAGRLHEVGGIAATKERELAIECRACPLPGINLPEGWEDAPAETA